MWMNKVERTVLDRFYGALNEHMTTDISNIYLEIEKNIYNYLCNTLQAFKS